MFGFQKKAEKVGSELIAEAVAEFESIAQKIEAGVAHNRASIESNVAHIAVLNLANGHLATHADNGERVAAKLRALIS